jgi:pSer/pThr/pTyr-binding forkhead associated (FHA) protein
VLDLKTKAGTYVNGKLIKSGKDQKAFRNDSIQIGSSKLKVITFNNKKKSDSAPTAAAKKAARASEAPAADEDVVMQETDNAANGHGPSLKIEFIEGPHKNTEVFFQQGVLEKLTLGSNPTAKSGETFELAGSSDANHARLELNVKRNFASLIVYDLKSKGGTFVKGEAVKKGKDHMAFRGDSIRLGEHLMVVKSA